MLHSHLLNLKEKRYYNANLIKFPILFAFTSLFSTYYQLYMAQNNRTVISTVLSLLHNYL